MSSEAYLFENSKHEFMHDLFRIKKLIYIG